MPSSLPSLSRRSIAVVATVLFVLPLAALGNAAPVVSEWLRIPGAIRTPLPLSVAELQALP